MGPELVHFSSTFRCTIDTMQDSSIMTSSVLSTDSLADMDHPCVGIRFSNPTYTHYEDEQSVALLPAPPDLLVAPRAVRPAETRAAVSIQSAWRGYVV